MDLSPESILFFNKSNLVFISIQILCLTIAFVLYKKSKFLITLVLLLSINFSFVLYIISENYKSFKHLGNVYQNNIPLVNVLGAFEYTQMFYIYEATILLTSLVFIYLLFKRKLS